MNSMHSTGAESGAQGSRRGAADIFRLFYRLLDRLSGLSLWVSGIGMVVLTVIFGWLVFGRYVLNATPTWVEQIALLLVSLIGFVGAASGVHERSHLGVSFFRDIAPRPVQRLMELLTYLIMGGFGLVMMVQTYKLVLFKWSTQIPLIDLPEGLRAVPLTFCGAACLLYSIGHLIRFFREKTPDPRNQSS
ncbi:MAG: TRAP transporter small permease [Nisaea sp.]|jgi:TRAP-type C4-dicarboxylate transport system permease small subunit|uniref:TRAP transporter small permease n=1 Tax=Nisaea sp. TaxID=2024842 RepID=UPI001B01F36E|nr:TRAP transporter small permease [Nisaea sp.]MBO6559002.1 TRAP transporter small permease [Nisaea sp.]